MASTKDINHHYQVHICSLSRAAVVVVVFSAAAVVVVAVVVVVVVVVVCCSPTDRLAASFVTCNC